MTRQKSKISNVSDTGSLQLTEDLIRMRAYQLFEKRGCRPGHDVDDWLEAEVEVMGDKPKIRADQNPSLYRVAAA